MIGFCLLTLITCCGVHNQRKRNTAYHIYLSLKTRPALTLTIASIHSNGGIYKCGFFALKFFFFFLKFAGIKFRDFQAVAKLTK